MQHLENKEFIQLPRTRPNTENSHMMFPVLVLSESREGLAHCLYNKGVGTRTMLPLTNQPCYKKLNLFDEKDYPVASFINEHGLYWGCHQAGCNHSNNFVNIGFLVSAWWYKQMIYQKAVFYL